MKDPVLEDIGSAAAEHNGDSTWKEQRSAALDILRGWLDAAVLQIAPRSTALPCSCADLGPIPPVTTHLFVVDDNMYYRSMRHEVYQVRASFGQFFLKVPKKDGFVKYTEHYIVP